MIVDMVVGLDCNLDIWVVEGMLEGYVFGWSVCVVFKFNMSLNMIFFFYE